MKKNNAKKLNTLKDKTENKMLNYYKATLAVTEYLINEIYNSKKETK